MKTFIVTLLAISASTNGSEHSGRYGSSKSGYAPGGLIGNVRSAGWITHSHPFGPVSGFASTVDQGSHNPHGINAPTEINTYIQPTKIITKIIKVPVHVPHLVPIEVKYPIPVPHPVRLEVDRPVPVPVPHLIHVYIKKPYPININRPVPVYITKPVAVPVPVTVGPNTESSRIHGINSQYGAPVIEESSPGDFGRQGHYGNAASSASQSFSDTSGHQSHQDHHTQELSSIYASSFTRSESKSQFGQLNSNYKAPTKAWN